VSQKISIKIFLVPYLAISYQYNANAFNLKQWLTNIFSVKGKVAKQENKCDKNGDIKFSVHDTLLE
jgi:hypothetical protein